MKNRILSDLDVPASPRFARAEGLVATEVDDHVVIMSVESGHFFGLNPVGSRIWDLLETARSEDAICEDLLAQFDVEPDACRAEVREFLDGMGSLGLVVRA